MKNKYNLTPSWERDLIKAGKEVFKKGWGRAILIVTHNGKRYKTKVELSEDYKDVKYGGTDPE